MPYMEDCPYPMDRHWTRSPLSDSSSTTSTYGSPASETTEPSVCRSHNTIGLHKRKRDLMAYTVQKRSKTRAISTKQYPASMAGRVSCRNSLQRDNDMNIAIPEMCGLPATVWSRVFMYLRPQSLGQLLQVNRTFRNCLEPPKCDQASQCESQDQITGHLDSERIWANARKRFHAHLPRPLHGCSELDMWRLIGGKSCQFCVQNSPMKPHPGQRTDNASFGNIRLFWPLSIRCCNGCLKNETVTEAEIVSSSLSYLLPALPFVIVNENVPLVALPPHQGTSGPILRTSKRYLRNRVKFGQQQTLEKSSLHGSAIAEEWLNDLSQVAAKRLKSAERWSRWEENGGSKKLRLPKAIRPSHHLNQFITPPGLNFVIQQCSAKQVPMQAIGPSASSVPSTTLTPSRRQTPPSSTYFPPPASFELAQLAKSTRVQEIIKRAGQAQPPIPLDILRYMPAFQAAHNIPRPLQDSEWPSLLQRFHEQKAEAEHLAQTEKQQLAMRSEHSMTLSPPTRPASVVAGHIALAVREGSQSSASSRPSSTAPYETTTLTRSLKSEIEYEEDIVQIETRPRQLYAAMRSQSRSPPNLHTTVHYRGQDKLYKHAYLPTVRLHRRVDSHTDDFYEYNQPSPPRCAITPQILYDEYGNEYVRRSPPRNQTSYVVHPRASQGYE